MGAAGVTSVNGALLRYTYPPSLLGRGIGLNALVVSAAAALGPTVAAGVSAVGPVEWLFAINVPIGVVAILIGSRWLPANPQDGKFDIVSTCLNVLTFGLAFTGIDALTRGGEVGFGCTEIALAALAGGASTTASKATSSARASRPFEEHALRDDGADFNRLLRRANAGFAVRLPGRAASKPGRHRTSDDALAAGGLFSAGVAASFAGHLAAEEYSPAILSGAGLGILALGLVSLGLMPTQTTSFEIAGLMAICGLGFGFFQAPNNRTMLSSAPMQRSGAAAGMLATARLTGQTIGATIAAIAFRFAGHAETFALVVAAAFALAGALASLSRLRFRGAVPKSEEHPIPTRRNSGLANAA